MKMKCKLPLSKGDNTVTILSLTTAISFYYLGIVPMDATYKNTIWKMKIKIGIEDLAFTLAEYLNVWFSEITSIPRRKKCILTFQEQVRILPF